MSISFEHKEKLEEKVLNMNVEELDISIRSIRLLKKAGINTVKDLIENFSKVTSIKNNYPKSYQEIVNKLECYGLTFDSDIKKATENTKSKKHKYGDIEEPTAEELAAIERELNPNELLHEDLFSGFSSEYDIDDRWLDFSRTEGGYKRKQKNVDKSNQNLNKDNINNISLDELGLPKRIITELNKIRIFNTEDLISQSRERLKTIKFIGSKGAEEIANALMQRNLHLENDEIFECLQCSKKYVQESNDDIKNYCTLCQMKKDRIAEIDLISVTLTAPEYSSYTGLGDGFDLKANIKNNSCDSLLKIQVCDFYIVSNGQQFSPECFLSGYKFLEEDIWPLTSRSCAKIWSNKKKSKVLPNDYAIISLKNSGITYMFKFLFDGSQWNIDDYFKS